jgi:hypothetical protein
MSWRQVLRLGGIPRGKAVRINYYRTRKQKDTLMQLFEPT